MADESYLANGPGVYKLSTPVSSLIVRVPELQNCGGTEKLRLELSKR